MSSLLCHPLCILCFYLYSINRKLMVLPVNILLAIDNKVPGIRYRV